MKVTYATKIKHCHRDDPNAWVKQRLHLDLLKDPCRELEEDEDAEEGLYYGLSFMKDTPEPNNGHHWFRVGKILDFHSEDDFYEFIEQEVDNLPDEITKKQMLIFRKNLERLYRAIWKDEPIFSHTEQDQDYDRILDIFVRAQGGTKLSKSDLLLSMSTSKWGGINARDEIFKFVDRINTALTRRNDFNKDFVMKTCLVCADLPVAYKVQNFNNRNLREIQKRWNAIKSAIERAVDLVNFFGIDRDNLTSANALIPLIYYLSHRPGLTLRGTTPFERKNSDLVRKWVGVALLNGVFGGSSDNTLRDSREALKSFNNRKEADFPVDEINKAAKRSGRTAYFNDDTVENVLLLKYGLSHTFLALTLLYEENGWGTITHHQDHIFPQRMFDPENLENAGFDQGRINCYRKLMNRLGNLQLLLAHENQEKQDRPFDKWITTRDRGFKDRHLIPDDPALWTLDRFDDFIKAREKLIATRLKQLFGDGVPTE